MSASSKGPAEGLLMEGLEHYLNGRLKEAVELWQGVLRIEPDNVRAREYLRSALNEYGPLRHRREGSAHAETGPGPTAWDDGPSAGPSITLDTPLDLPQLPADLNTPPPDRNLLPPTKRSELDSLLAGARELYALNDFSGVLELLEKVFVLDPTHAEALRMREDCAETLVQMYESQLGSLNRVPELAVNPDEIIWLNLDHRAGFVLAQIDGSVSYDDLYSICGMSRLDTSRILAQLVSEKVIRSR